MKKIACIAGIALLMVGVAQANLAGNLVAYYDFETDLSNQAGALYDGSTVNGPWQTDTMPTGPGFTGNAAYEIDDGLSDRGTMLVGNALNIYDGDNTTVSVPLGTAQLGQTFSISAWTYLAPGANNSSPRFNAFEAANNWDVTWGTLSDDTSLMQSYVGEGGKLSPDIAITHEQWQHVVQVFTSDGTTTTLDVYIDGVTTPAASGTGLTAIMDFAGLNIGDYRGGTTDRTWDGMIDEFAVWNRALTTTEVAELYNLGVSGQTILSSFQTPIAARVDVNPRSGVPTSVTILSQTMGANLWVDGGNEGDFGLGYPGSSIPLLQANGVIIANCNELPASGRGSVAVVGNFSYTGGSSVNGGMWIASFTSALNGSEDNYDFSFGWFPYSLGGIGGHINATGTGFDGSGNLPAGSTVSNAVSDGVYKGEYLLTLDGIDPRTDGMLFVVDGRNNDNIAVAGVPSLDTIEGSNSWHIAAFDESGGFDAYEQGQVSFLYVPYSTEGLCGGWIGSDGTEKESRGRFIVTRAATGQYELVIPDDAGGYYDDSDGILLLTVARLIENGSTGDGHGVDDNAIAWAYDASANGGDGAFVVETYDLDRWNEQDTEFVFAFVLYDGLLDVPGPPRGTVIGIN